MFLFLFSSCAFRSSSEARKGQNPCGHAVESHEDSGVQGVVRDVRRWQDHRDHCQGALRHL